MQSTPFMNRNPSYKKVLPSRLLPKIEESLSFNEMLRNPSSNNVQQNAQTSYNTPFSSREPMNVPHHFHSIIVSISNVPSTIYQYIFNDSIGQPLMHRFFATILVQIFCWGVIYLFLMLLSTVFHKEIQFSPFRLQE